MPLNNYMEYMPNLDAIIKGDDNIRRQCYTDSGYLASIPAIKVIGDGHTPQMAWSGYVVRQDWLNEMSLEVPNTYDELETVLTAMQADYSTAAHPLYFTSNLFNDPSLYAGYNINDDWIVKDGTVAYSPLEDGSKVWIGPFANPTNDPAFDLSLVQWEQLIYNIPGYTQVDREYCLVDEKAIGFCEAWDSATGDMIYPSSATMTAEENEAYGSSFNDIETHVTEQSMKFVMGEKNFDADWAKPIWRVLGAE